MVTRGQLVMVVMVVILLLLDGRSGGHQVLLVEVWVVRMRGRMV